MKKAFTLIELLVVITILAILAGAAFPYVQEYIEESRQAKAKSDLDEIAKALILYESREGEYIKNTVEDLTGRYLDRSPIDPWGVPYLVSTQSKVVYSLGPDRMGYEEGEDYAFDNIQVPYEPPLALVSAKWIDKNKSGAVDTQNVPDEIQLSFSRKIAPVDGIEVVDESLLPDLLSKIIIYRDSINPDSFETIDSLVDANANNAPKFLIGDANQDGTLNVADAIMINNIISYNGYNPWADVNEDGNINVADITALVSIILGSPDKGYLSDPNFKNSIYITSASHSINLPLKPNAPLINRKYFIPGQAKIAIKENHNLIKDNSYPYPNYCISNQKVTIQAK